MFLSNDSRFSRRRKLRMAGYLETLKGQLGQMLFQIGHKAFYLFLS